MTHFAALVVTAVLAAASSVGATLVATRMRSRETAMRLAALSENTLNFALGQPPGPPDSGDDEIAKLDARFRLVYEMLADREAAAARYRILAEHNSDIMLFLENGRIVEANEAASATYGYSRDEMCERSIFDLRAPESHDQLESILARPDDFREVYEATHRRRDGSTFPVEITLRHATIAGRSIIFIIGRDISARRIADARLQAALAGAKEASRLKSEFVATISHEIRTPMNAILGMTELLLESGLDYEQRELATVARDAGRDLLQILDDVLDFSKMESGKLHMETQAFDVTTCVESAAQLLALQAHRKGLVLTAFVPPDMPHLVLGDEMRVRQVLTNLLGNAVKFTAAGRVAVAVSIVERRESRLTVRFEVADTGIGLSPGASVRLFTAFEQADGSITRRYGGTGLGLAISKRLVEMMGGTIGVKSRESLGSTFWFELPLHIDRAPELADRTLAHAAVLVVDADRHTCDITARYLRAWGLDVDEAATREAALDRCERRRAQGVTYGLVVVDAAVAPDTIARFANDLRRTTGRPDLPMLLTANFDSVEAGRRVMEAGFRGFLSRPFKQSLLFDCVATFLDRANGNESNADDSNAPSGAPSANADVGAAATVERDADIADALGHVLLVEDNPVNQRVGRKQLEKIGYSVTCADNGRIALDTLRKATYDLVLMDLHMPELDGLSATKAIRRDELLSGGHVPIVALTADAQPKDLAAALNSGMDDYLSKPVSMADLRRVLARWAKSPARE